MLQAVNSNESPFRLDRDRWWTPKISVIVTHHNYSDHVEDALLSLLDQTYEHWECVVVDDASDPEHVLALEAIVKKIGDKRITLRKLDENVGQTPAAFAGLDCTDGPFVCVLDPDDRYAPRFLQEAVSGHLNGSVYCPILSTDQFLICDEQLITCVYSHQQLRFLEPSTRGASIVPELPEEKLLYFPSWVGGWHWGSTSSLMFRRAAVEFMRPPNDLNFFRSVDSYLAQGAHLMGGSLFLTKSLVYRTIHPNNSYLTDRVFALGQDKGRYDGAAHSKICREAVIEAIKMNGGESFLFKPQKKRRKGILARWQRSMDKRWKRLTGQPR